MFLKGLKLTCIFAVIAGLIMGTCISILRFIEYVEENTYAAKKRIQYLIYGVTLMHFLYIWQGMPLFQLGISLITVYIFNCLLQNYPSFTVEDPLFIGGNVLILINHFLLIRFFMYARVSIISVIISFTTLWSIPFCFFFSITVVDSMLFVKNDKKVKTYAGIAKDYLMNVGRKRNTRIE
ncbi:TX261 [Hepatospora eriocheir]|uniref:TX261 n=1 Tax=Hepatospora eriocheir TaxID=1081669 RepID=A0A1X0QDP8_9MICR|nr:TX261 [Hepatospora eriocheir]ORE00011.1 TX261 [Hepatospora eriocheir]